MCLAVLPFLLPSEPLYEMLPVRGAKPLQRATGESRRTGLHARSQLQKRQADANRWCISSSALVLCSGDESVAIEDLEQCMVGSSLPTCKARNEGNTLRSAHIGRRQRTYRSAPRGFRFRRAEKLRASMLVDVNTAQSATGARRKKRRASEGIFQPGPEIIWSGRVPARELGKHWISGIYTTVRRAQGSVAHRPSRRWAKTPCPKLIRRLRAHFRRPFDRPQRARGSLPTAPDVHRGARQRPA